MRISLKPAQLGALALLFVLARARVLFAPVLDTDETIFHAIAARLDAGDLLYVDVFDVKPPGVFAFYWTVRAVFGEGLGPVHAVTTALVAGVALVLGWSASRFVQRSTHEGSVAAPGAGFWAAALFLACHGLGDAGSGASSSTEQLASLPIALGMAFLLRGGSPWTVAFAGLFLGVAPLIKPQAGAALVAAFLVVLVWPAARARLRLLRAAALVLGAAAVPILVVAYFASSGRFDALLRWSLREGLAYAGNRDVAGFFDVGNLLQFLALHAFPLALAAYGFRARWRQARPSPADLLLASWLAFAVAATFVGGRFYWNYFVLVSPPLALAAGLGAWAVWPRLGRALRVAAALVLIAPSVASQLHFVHAEHRGRGSLRAGHRALAREAKARLRPGDTFYVFGSAAPVYYAAGVLPVEAFVGADYVFGFMHPTLLRDPARIDDYARPVRLAELRAVLSHPRVRVLVDSPYSAWREHSMERVPKVMALVTALGYRKVHAGARGGVWER